MSLSHFSDEYVFAVSEDQCMSNGTAHERYVMGNPSEACLGGAGSEESISVYSSAKIPTGQL